MSSKAITALVAVTVGCADVKIGEIVWQGPPECALDATPGEDAGAYDGDPTINTLHVTVFRLPSTVTTCGGCIADTECQPVGFACRCGPSGSVEEAVPALRDLQFDGLDADRRFCVRVAQFDIDINEMPEWGRECGAEFSCAGLLGLDGLIEKRVRACSVSEVVQFPGSVDISHHGCRATSLDTTRRCMRLSNAP